MEHLPNADKRGFCEDKSRLENPDSISIRGLEFPKSIPSPQYITETKLTYKSAFAPEYEQYQNLFKCHSMDSDFYIEFQSPQLLEKKIDAKPLMSSFRNMSCVNAFSSAYKEEVEGFNMTLCALIPVFQRKQGRNIQKLIDDAELLKREIESCSQIQTVDHVNQLREMHASLLQKYSSYL